MTALRLAARPADVAEFTALCADLDPVAARIMTRLLERIVELQALGAEDEIFALVEEIGTIVRTEPLVH